MNIFHGLFPLVSNDAIVKTLFTEAKVKRLGFYYTYYLIIIECFNLIVNEKCSNVEKKSTDSKTDSRTLNNIYLNILNVMPL